MTSFDVLSPAVDCEAPHGADAELTHIQTKFLNRKKFFLMCLGWLLERTHLCVDVSVLCKCSYEVHLPHMRHKTWERKKFINLCRWSDDGKWKILFCFREQRDEEEDGNKMRMNYGAFMSWTKQYLWTKGSADAAQTVRGEFFLHSTDDDCLKLLRRPHATNICEQFN